MGGMITVREARPGDGDVLGEIHSISWGISHGPLCTPKVAAAGIQERRTKWDAVLAEGKDAILLARKTIAAVAKVSVASRLGCQRYPDRSGDLARREASYQGHVGGLLASCPVGFQVTFIASAGARRTGDRS
ncbi:hypothetical protein [Microbispora rosea]|uniref:hypothetical protein n=1 Tax=Microbispora rosea TaxID=58117 RepID=UPI0033DEB8DE